MTPEEFNADLQRRREAEEWRLSGMTPDELKAENLRLAQKIVADAPGAIQAIEEARARIEAEINGLDVQIKRDRRWLRVSYALIFVAGVTGIIANQTDWLPPLATFFLNSLLAGLVTGWGGSELWKLRK